MALGKIAFDVEASLKERVNRKRSRLGRSMQWVGIQLFTKWVRGEVVLSDPEDPPQPEEKVTAAQEPPVAA